MRTLRVEWVSHPLFILGRRMAGSSIQERIEDIAKQVTDGTDVEFVHCQIAGSKSNPTVRLTIDRPDGVSLDDCADFSRGVESFLDRDDFIPTSYTLEVSSPGIERDLYKIEDYRRFAGQSARLKTDRPIDGQRHFAGRIVSVKDDNIEFDDRTNGLVQIPFDAVVKGNLMVDLDQEF